MALHIDTFLQIAVQKKASDLHLVAGLPPVLRINGVLSNILDQPPLTSSAVKDLVFAILNEKQKEKFINTKELDISYQIGDAMRFRINLHWEKNNVGLVGRVINERIPTMDELQFPDIVKQLLQINQGLILVTGPTGCGKSTSLASMIDFINNQRFMNIITLEDPIEYVFKPVKSIIKQRQYEQDIVSFAEGLKHALRQDPNVLMVGEMRDLETIATTITIAETGHLVLATLHTYNAEQTIDRIIDVFPAHQQQQVRTQLALILQGIISQRLLPLKDGSGRVAVREILLNTTAVANMIRENKVHQIKNVIHTSVKEGMVTMDRDINRVYQEGLISKETALSYISDPGILNE